MGFSSFFAFVNRSNSGHYPPPGYGRQNSPSILRQNSPAATAKQPKRSMGTAKPAVPMDLFFDLATENAPDASHFFCFSGANWVMTKMSPGLISVLPEGMMVSTPRFTRMIRVEFSCGISAKVL